MKNRCCISIFALVGLLLAFALASSASAPRKESSGASTQIFAPTPLLESIDKTETFGPVGYAHGVPMPPRVLLAFAANASGDNASGDVFYSNPAPSSWQNMLGLASQFWGASPNCPNGVSMMTMKPGSSNVSAKADQGGCRMWISTTVLSRAFPRERCIIVVHEWGHLLGKGHTSGIMAADASIYDQKVPVCDALATVVNGAPVKGFYPLPLSMKQAKKLTRGLFLSSFKVKTCKRVNYYRIKCKLANSKGQRRASTISRYSNGYKLLRK